SEWPLRDPGSRPPDRCRLPPPHRPDPRAASPPAHPLAAPAGTFAPARAPDDRDMTSPLDVLVIESHPGVAASAVHALETAGHHVHRCYDDDSLGFPCRAVGGPAECPLR